MPLFHRTTFALAVIATLGILVPAPARGQSEQIRRFVRLYDATRRADQTTQKLVLELDPGGRAVLTTMFFDSANPGASAPAAPLIEKGAWSVANQYAIVHLTKRANGVEGKHDTYKTEDVALTFSLGFGCTLKLERDDANVFGKDGLRMKGRGC
jgi:hypothetical protein